MFLLVLFSQFSAVTPTWSNIFGANIDINLKTCKQFPNFFRKKPKKLSRNQRSAVILTFLTRFFDYLRGLSS